MNQQGVAILAIHGLGLRLFGYEIILLLRSLGAIKKGFWPLAITLLNWKDYKDFYVRIF